MRVGTVLIVAMGALCPLAMGGATPGKGDTGVLVVVSYASTSGSLEVDVAVTGPGGATYSDTLYDAATAKFAGLAEGTYTVRVAGSAGSTPIAGEVTFEMYADVVRTIQVGVADDGSPLVVCTATGPGSPLIPEFIVGRVVDADMEPQQPIVDADVVVVDRDLSTRTDENGVYVFPAVPGDINKVCVTAPGFPEQCALVEGNSSQNFSLFTPAEGEGEGEPRGALTGVVTDADTQAPIAGATLTIAALGNLSVSTDSGGVYTFTDVLPSLPSVEASADGYESQSEWVVVEADEIATLDFELTPTTSEGEGEREGEGEAPGPICNAGTIGPPPWRGPGNAAGDLFILALVLALLSAARRKGSAPRATR